MKLEPGAIGQRAIRLDAAPKVMGTAVYAADFSLPGMLHGKVLRSPHAHALIRGIDVSRARAAPGVRAVITAADIPNVRWGPAVKDMTVFARDRVHHVGEAVAAVAAITPEAASAALALIRVDYEIQPAVFDAEDAMMAGAPIIHPEWASYEALPTLSRQANRSGWTRVKVGDVEQGFANSYRIFSDRFTTGLVHAGYTEPRAAVASWESADRVTVWSNTQLPFDTQSDLAEILALTPSQVRVIVPGIGGGFGGKLQIGVEHYVCLLARCTRCPVKIVSTIQEELTSAFPRFAAHIELKTGVDRDGHILAKQGRVILDTGACANYGPRIASSSTLVLAGPYRIPNLSIEAFSVYTNKMPASSVRSPSGPMSNFATESQMDIIADALGLDPLEIRLRNIVDEGDLSPTGQPLHGVGLRECLERAAAAIGWERKAGANRGKGLACGWWVTAGGSSGVSVILNPDGSATMITGAIEIGTGALSGAAQILAEELEISVGKVVIGGADTRHMPFDSGSQGSRTTAAVGNACRAAAISLKGQLRSLAAQMLETEESAIELRDGAAWAGNSSASLSELAGFAQRTRGALVGYGTFRAPIARHDPDRVEHHQLPVWNDPSFHAHAVDLSVDSDTGEITLHRYVVAQDVGRAINPMGIEGQIEGGVAQGIGQALSEEIVVRDGHVMNCSLTDYKMPTALDVPPIETIIVEHAGRNGPYGAKGVGEPPCIEPPAAIANAVASATGLRITSLPITAEKIVTAQLSKRLGESAETP